MLGVNAPLIAALRLCVLVGVITTTIIFPGRASENVTVSVRGTGASIEEARTDAIRQALQQTITQLVVVDRAINNSKVLRDNVISTMNGYVEKFHEKAVGKEANRFSVLADVTISSSRIENFIGVTSGGAAPLDGSSLLGEANRESAQRKARGEIFDRLFRGFPSEIVDVKILAIRPNDRDPGSLSIKLEYGLKPLFKKSLIDTLRVLSQISCNKMPPSAGFDRECDDFYYAHDAANRDYDFVGVLDENSKKYMLLKPGNYCSFCSAFLGRGGSILLLARFIDDAGGSVLTQNKKCIAWSVAGNNIRGNLMWLSEPGNPSGKKRLPLYVDFSRIKTQVTVSRSAADLAASKHLVILPAWQRGSAEWTWDVTDESTKGSGCNPLDLAVQHQLLTR